MSTPRWTASQSDPLAPDPAALDEIDLYSELMIVANASAEPLTRAQIDRALGLDTDRLASSL